MNACTMRIGVHGSSRPGLRTTGIFRATAGIQMELTPGELLGSTTPSERAAGE